MSGAWGELMSPPSGQESVLRADQAGLSVLWLNRPDVHNAIDGELRLRLGDMLAECLDDPGVRAVVLAGAGKSFCAGGDIADMRKLSQEEARPRTEAAQRIVSLIWQGKTPVLAAVHGAAFGAGLSLSLACDYVVAADDARLSTAFLGVGLAGDLGVTASLPARVGAQAARRLFLLPRVLSGSEALGLGMVDECVPAPDVLRIALDRASRIAEHPPLALAAVRSMLWHNAGMGQGALERELAVQCELFATEDLDEGAAAFRERRPPSFHGR